MRSLIKTIGNNANSIIVYLDPANPLQIISVASLLNTKNKTIIWIHFTIEMQIAIGAGPTLSKFVRLHLPFDFCFQASVFRNGLRGAGKTSTSKPYSFLFSAASSLVKVVFHVFKGKHLKIYRASCPIFVSCQQSLHRDHACPILEMVSQIQAAAEINEIASPKLNTALEWSVMVAPFQQTNRFPLLL
jgi:hypothetical protein